VIVTAGIYVSPDANGNVADEQWGVTFDVNVTGPFLLADEANSIWQAQELSGSLVITTSVNAVVPKVGSMAYDTSKAATNHLVRELAIKLAPRVRVNGVAPATVLSGSAMFSRDRVIASLVKYSIAFQQTEATDELRDKLAHFYAMRSLTGRPVLAEDQAAAIVFLASEEARCTTGQILTVDGGLADAFLR
jgi:NAD(P)-dependent dehydrogenase (short-subunit alcohol dehydrogenase family)